MVRSHLNQVRTIENVLLVSSSYDAYIMEEGQPLLDSLRLIDGQTFGLALPHITRVSTGEEALSAISNFPFDLVIGMSRIADMSVFVLSDLVKEIRPSIPFFVLSQYPDEVEFLQREASQYPVNHVFIWSGNPDLFFAMIKCWEDETYLCSKDLKFKPPTLLVVEDSPLFLSSILSLLYTQIFQHLTTVFKQESVLYDRSEKIMYRPRILVAHNFAEAQVLYERYQDFIFAVISDHSLHSRKEDPEDNGGRLLGEIRSRDPEIPLLLMSTELVNQRHALLIGASFSHKDSSSFDHDMAEFLRLHLGFGDFIFRLENGQEIGKARNLKELQEYIASVPEESLRHHVQYASFSRWLLVRTEISLAHTLKNWKAKNLEDINSIREYLLEKIRQFREARFVGVVTNFVRGRFDDAVPFCKIGVGSLGGKGRGLAFMSQVLKDDSLLETNFPEVRVCIPQTLVIATGWYERFLKENPKLPGELESASNKAIKDRFLKAKLPELLRVELRTVLESIKEPIAVRSSGLFEDNHYKAYAGLYSTFMLPNCHPELENRQKQLETAIKLVYASVFLEEAHRFTLNSLYRREEEKMGIILQRMVGKHYGEYFYPWVSGVAQSRNFYPVSSMRAEEGIVHIALGMGKSVCEGGEFLSFSPHQPEAIAGFSSMEEILQRSQRSFFALKMENEPPPIFQENSTLELKSISDSLDEPPVQYLTSTYSPEDHCVRDSHIPGGMKVVSFARLLKYNPFPFGELLRHLLEVGEKEFGCPVEMEFSLNLSEASTEAHELYLLQFRPLSYPGEQREVEITLEELESSVCYSDFCLGNGITHDIFDIVFVNPDTFTNSKTEEIAAEIGRLNLRFQSEGMKYLLIGPGRWGSSDHHLGIPVEWQSINHASAIVETHLEDFQPDPSLGSHLFYNMITQGIYYFTVKKSGGSFIDWDWLQSHDATSQTTFLKHISLNVPITIKVSGKRNQGAILHPSKLA